MEIRDYIEESMRKLVCRMPYIQLTKSNISDKNIGELEDTIQKKLPDSIKAYLMSYSLSVPIVTGRLISVVMYGWLTWGWMMRKVPMQLVRQSGPR